MGPPLYWKFKVFKKWAFGRLEPVLSKHNTLTKVYAFVAAHDFYDKDTKTTLEIPEEWVEDCVVSLNEIDIEEIDDEGLDFGGGSDPRNLTSSHGGGGEDPSLTLS